MNYEEIINNLKDEIATLRQEIQNSQSNFIIPDHIHNGTDASGIRYDDIVRKKILLHNTIQGSNAATATNYGTYFIASQPMLVNAIYEIHQTAGTDGSAVTLQIEKLTGTTAAGSGNALLASAFSLKSTANTLQTGSLTTTLPYKSLAKGDRLAMKLTGTPTSVSNVSVLIELIII